MREIKRLLALVAVPAMALLPSPAAAADADPQGCVAADPVVVFASGTLEQIKNPVRPGDSIDLGVRMANPGPSTCYLSDIKVLVRLPDENGAPGDLQSLGGRGALASGTSVEQFPLGEPYVVALGDVVFEATLELHWEANLYSDGKVTPISGVGTPARLSVTRPRVDLTVVPSSQEGPSPLETTYVYLLTNDSPAGATGLKAPSLVASGPAGPRDALSDENCSPLVFISGDDGPSALLSPGETWKFHCTKVHMAPGDYLSQPSVTGTSDVDGRPWPQPQTGALHPPVRVYGPDLVVDKSHEGDFLADGPGEYRISVSNLGNQPTSGAVWLTDRLPSGLTATAISGDGWDCDLASLNCTRSDTLESGAAYPDVVLTVRTSPRPPAHVDNVAIVSGGGEPPGAESANTDTDRTRIRNPAQPAAQPKPFMLLKVAPRPDGSAALRLRVPRAGRVIVDDARRPDRLKKTKKKVRKARKISALVKPGRKLRRRLARTGRPRAVSVQMTFIPRRGRGHTEVIVRRIKLSVARASR